MLDGSSVLLLGSNNYLGLADHPKVRRAAARAASSDGTGSGASRLISGNMDCHESLEAQLAAFIGTERTLLFGSGYLANLGAIATIAELEPGGVVFSDELNHASIIDGCRLAHAETFVYRHRDLEHLEWGLRRAGERARMIVTDALFSMDGDLAPIPGVVDLAERHEVLTMVDEAHSLGCFGPEGRGVVAEFGMSSRVDLLVGTLGKALGSYGAFVGSSARTRELLINRSRPFIFSTAPPPPAIAAASRALELIGDEPQRVERLRRNSRLLREQLANRGLAVEDSDSQIIPLVIGDASKALSLSERLLAEGIYAQAIRPPTVPDGTSRLRLSVMSEHREDDLRKAAGTIARCCDSLGIEVQPPLGSPETLDRIEAEQAA